MNRQRQDLWMSASEPVSNLLVQRVPDCAPTPSSEPCSVTNRDGRCPTGASAACRD
jgi:hypothetical protein